MSSNKLSSILIVGIGNMGSALVRGLLSNVASVDFCQEIRIYDSSYEKAARFARESRVKVLEDLGGARDEQLVLLAIKPQDLPVVAEKLRGKIADTATVISILAGITTEDIADILKHDGAVVRGMPNIAGMVGQAATAMCANGETSTVQMQQVKSLFSTIGEAYWTKEANLDAVTGLSGSGPAYVYMFIEALTDGGVKMGLPRQLALDLAIQTVLGSAKLAKETSLHPAILRDQVTTPGGTTISAIHELEAHGLRAMLMSAVSTATEQSAKLRKKRTKK